MTNLQGNVQQLQGRINNQILGVKGLRLFFEIKNLFKHQENLIWAKVNFCVSLWIVSRIMSSSKFIEIPYQKETLNKWFRVQFG